MLKQMCYISFAKSWIEDCWELNFKYVNYQTLAYLSYISCVCWTSVHAKKCSIFQVSKHQLVPIYLHSAGQASKVVTLVTELLVGKTT